MLVHFPRRSPLDAKPGQHLVLDPGMRFPAATHASAELTSVTQLIRLLPEQGKSFTDSRINFHWIDKQRTLADLHVLDVGQSKMIGNLLKE